MPPRSTLVAQHPSLEPLLDPARSAQRARLLEGMTQVVSEKGYVDASVADVVRAARVSRRTFYELFESKEACFLEAYEHGVEVLDARIGSAVAEATGGWHGQLRAGLRAYLDVLAEEPRFARTYGLEIHAAGPRAQAARDAALRRFARRYRGSYEEALRERPELRIPSDDDIFVLAAGIDQLVCARVRAGEFELLADLLDTLQECAIALIEGVSAMTTATNEVA